MPMAGVDLGTVVTKQNSYLYYLDREGNIQLGRQINADSYSEWVSYEDIPENLIVDVARETADTYRLIPVDALGEAVIVLQPDCVVVIGGRRYRFQK